MTLGHIDGWLVQPGEPADQLLFPAIAELVDEWYGEVVRSPPQSAAVQVVATPQSAAVQVVATPQSPRWDESHNLLVRNDIPHRLIAADSDEATRLLAKVGQPRSRLPAARPAAVAADAARHGEAPAGGPGTTISSSL